MVLLHYSLLHYSPTSRNYLISKYIPTAILWTSDGKNGASFLRTFMFDIFLHARLKLQYAAESEQCIQTSKMSLHLFLLNDVYSIHNTTTAIVSVFSRATAITFLLKLNLFTKVYYKGENTSNWSYHIVIIFYWYWIWN